MIEGTVVLQNSIDACTHMKQNYENAKYTNGIGFNLKPPFIKSLYGSNALLIR